MHHRTLYLLVFASTLFAYQPRLLGDLVINPSFESPAIAAGSFRLFSAGNTIGSGWTVASNVDVVAIISSGFAGVPARDGNQFLLLGSADSSVTQDFTLAASTTYRLGFLLGDEPLDGLTNGARIDISRNGTSVIGGPAEFTVLNGGGFQARELLFTTNVAGSYRLSVSATPNSGYMDSFSLVTAVPEPSSFGLVAFAAGVFARLRSKKSWLRS